MGHLASDVKIHTDQVVALAAVAHELEGVGNDDAHMRQLLQPEVATGDQRDGRVVLDAGDRQRSPALGEELGDGAAAQTQDQNVGRPLLRQHRVPDVRFVALVHGDGLNHSANPQHHTPVFHLNGRPPPLASAPHVFLRQSPPPCASRGISLISVAVRIHPRRRAHSSAI